MLIEAFRLFAQENWTKQNVQGLEERKRTAQETGRGYADG
jgi:hypothetical protein